MKIKITSLPEGMDNSMPEKFVFGRTFANRMFTQRYERGHGWQDPEIGLYAPISLMPATAVFHYGQEIFEGLKAYRRPDGNINLFRPWENARRFNASAERMRMPHVDEEDHLQAMIDLVTLEHAWVPSAPESSLYLRPFMIATEPALGVHASESYLHCIIVGPVGAYFSTGLKPVSVYISDEYVRAAAGGTGAAKTGGNYAASLYVAEQVKAKGYQQVLWLDAKEHRYVEEVGAMNIAFVYDGKHIATPALSGSILAGITRDSLLRLAPDLGYTVSEEQLDINDILRDIESGKITEAFGCGTAAVIAPVGDFGFKGKTYTVGNGQIGPVSAHLRQSLTDIQWGRVPDPYHWTHTIQVAEPILG